MRRFTFTFTVLLGVLTLPCIGLAQDGPSTVEGMDPRTYDVWNRHWRRIAMKVIAFEGDYVAMPRWEPRYPSSRHMTPDMYRKSKTVKIRERYLGTMVRDAQFVPPVEEGRIGAMTLPQMAPGHYGHIHSFEVVEVLGPEEMIIDNVWLIDAEALRKERDKFEADLKRKVDSREATDATEKMFEARLMAEGAQRDRSFRTQMRLVGFPTREVFPKDRWPRKGDDLPIAVAVLRLEAASGGRLSGRKRLVLGPAEWFHQTLTQEQFIDMLQKRGMTPTQFVDAMTAAFRNEGNPDAADSVIFAELERRRIAASEAAAETDKKDYRR